MCIIICFCFYKLFTENSIFGKRFFTFFSKKKVISTNFISKYNFPFDLLSDADGKLCEAFGVWVEKSMYGKKYFGIERSTFLINPKGEIAHIWRKVSVKGHVDNVIKVLETNL